MTQTLRLSDLFSGILLVGLSLKFGMTLVHVARLWVRNYQ